MIFSMSGFQATAGDMSLFMINRLLQIDIKSISRDRVIETPIMVLKSRNQWDQTHLSAIEIV